AGIVLSAVGPALTLAGEDSLSAATDDPTSTRAREIQEIKHQIQRLQERVDELEKQNSCLQRTNAEIKATNQQLQASTTQQLQSPQSQLGKSSSPASFAEAVNRYLGNYRFTLVGGVAGSFIYDRESNINTFALDLEPIVLWRLSDRMLFEGTIEANLPSGSS